MSNEKEVTLREGTIHALEGSLDEFNRLKDIANSIANDFEKGEEEKALESIRDDILDQLVGLYQFSYSLIDLFSVVIGKENSEKLTTQVKTLDQLFNTLSDETEEGNFTEVADILRFELSDLLTDMSQLFPQFIEQFKASKLDELDAV